MEFDLGSQESMNVPLWIYIGFQQDQQDSQKLKNDAFCRLNVTSCQCIFGNKKHPESCILLNYDDDDYFQAYGQIKEVFRALTKDDILQPYISDNDFRSSNVRVDVLGYNLFVFDKRYQQNFTASQPVKVEFKFDRVDPNDVNGHVLLLTLKLVGISSGGQRHFDLI